ncbi:phosphotransferase [[Brevibacterium] frigoritolerans]|uniref:Phosphotransferase n=1 Tax=Peribacillus frigoritolerans TaxID=450367 RepID=A0A941FMZ8_9BACI|nr:phosphotransferase [Peribacillus frigoritolerans]
MDVQHPISLVHGDIHIRNVLLDDEGVLAGVIDWEMSISGIQPLISPFIQLFPKRGAQCFFRNLW